MIEILHSDFIIYCFFVYTISNVCLFVCLFAAGNFTFSRFDPENVIPMHLLPRITIFEPERDEIRVKFNFVQLTPKNVNSCVFARKLRFSSSHEAIEILSASNFKYELNNGQISFCPINSQKVPNLMCFCSKVKISQSS